jgi:hypothetical protein
MGMSVKQDLAAQQLWRRCFWKRNTFEEERR